VARQLCGIRKRRGALLPGRVAVDGIGLEPRIVTTDPSATQRATRSASLQSGRPGWLARTSGRGFCD
jgi:hypothetical protein